MIGTHSSSTFSSRLGRRVFQLGSFRSSVTMTLGETCMAIAENGSQEHGGGMKKARFTEDGVDVSRHSSEGRLEGPHTSEERRASNYRARCCESDLFSFIPWILLAGSCDGLSYSAAELLELFGDLPPAIMAMEACGSSQHQARRLTSTR